MRAGWLMVGELKDISRITSLLEQDMTWTDAYVLAFAQEQQADQLISDDLEVRTRALELGFQVFGTLGVLIEGRRDGRFPNLKAVLHQLIQAGFYLNPESSLYQEVLRRVGERG